MQRITPTHFIEVYMGKITKQVFVLQLNCQVISELPDYLNATANSTNLKTVWVWLIAPKKEHSQIYLQGKTK